MRGMYTDAILMTIAERPGIRAVEIADKVDCDIELVEASIKEEIAAGNVRREVVTGPNARPTVAFWMKGTPATPKAEPLPRPPKPAPPAAVVKAPARPAPAAEAPPEEKPAEAPAIVAPPHRTLVDKAMAFILSQPDHTATDDELRAVMGLDRNQHPSVYLSTQRKKGLIHKDDDRWRLGQRKTIDGPAPAPESDADFRCALWSDGVLHLARGDRIALRLTNAEVKHLRSYLAGSRVP